MIDQTPYKKSWVAVTCIARDMICLSAGDRIPTVQDYTESLDLSRGIVQNALQFLQREHALVLEKRGKTGSFVQESNPEKLFALANLEYITGSMAPPLTYQYSALATGVCEAMTQCPATFNFSFMHSGRSRVRALSRSIYDFAITSLNTARYLTAKDDTLSIAMTLTNCIYSQPFQLVSTTSSRFPGAGDRIAADPNSPDQYSIACQLAAQTHAKLVPSPYMHFATALREGQANFTVTRQNETDAYPHVVHIIPLETFQNPDMMIPAVLVNRDNYGIAQILQKYLDPCLIASVQNEVLNGQREASFY